MYKIKIELMSDLCASDGNFMFNDADTAVDKYGIPFIPAKRLKGCLKEAALYINEQYIDEIFGTSGKKGSLEIDDAFVENYDELVCESIRYSPQFITSIFTDTSFCISSDDEGIMKNNSLRYVKTVNKYIPWDSNKNTAFFSDIRIDEKYVPFLDRICRSMRHIGYKRTRGLGFVKCSLEKVNSPQRFEINISKNYSTDKNYILEYAVRLDENMMISGSVYDNTCDFIGGQSVMGMLASEYLKNHSADNTFEQLFLSGNVKFSNLYITDESLSEFIPSLMSVNQNKGKYISDSSKSLDVETEIICHNHKGSSYVRVCLEKGQIFRGSIICSGDKMPVIAKLLQNADISFGRSRTAQYSRCTLVSAEINEYQPDEIIINPDDIVLFFFESDAVIFDEKGSVPDSVENAAEILGVKGGILPCSILKYKTVSGFVSSAKMQKPHVRAVSAGSVIAVKYDKYTMCDRIFYVGQKQGEGYGKIRTIKQNDFNEAFRSQLHVSQNQISSVNENIKAMFGRISFVEEMYSDALSYINQNRRDISGKWNNVALKRLANIIEASMDFDELMQNINGIVSENRKIAVLDMLRDSDSDKYTDWEDKKFYLKLVSKLIKYVFRQGKEQ
ncbi:MAG: hypothetical protein J6I55_05370 [Ruminococcus sp.]|nr:hypothetical protein [Ruminococcus sp.]